jgi:uncharacterized protein YjiS (DUF1127 family)
MTLLSHTSGNAGTSDVWKRTNWTNRRLSRLLNGWVAAFLARREQQAAESVLCSLSDRELRDMGLYRGQIGQALDDAAKHRASRQTAHDAGS